MSASRVQLVALLIVTLLFGALQCVASCAVEDCSSAVPPCHQHHAPSQETSAACTHDFLLPNVQASPLDHIATIGFVALAVSNVRLLVVDEIVASPAFSPPSPYLSSSSILRI
jgi:hypothetical protein